MTNTKSSVSWIKNKRKQDRFKVGDLVTCQGNQLVYMLVNRDNTLPYRAGSGTLKGVCVYSSPGGRDTDGCPLPQVGTFHDNLGENHLKRFTGTVELRGYE